MRFGLKILVLAVVVMGVGMPAMAADVGGGMPLAIGGGTAHLPSWVFQIFDYLVLSLLALASIAGIAPFQASRERTRTVQATARSVGQTAFAGGEATTRDGPVMASRRRRWSSCSWVSNFSSRTISATRRFSASARLATREDAS